MTGERLLVVDDEQILRIGTAWTLREAGFEVDEADCGAAAIEMVKHTRYALIFMDLNMPGMGGFECVGKIRAWERQSKPAVPRSVIIALSATNDADARAHSLRAGMNDFLEKSSTKEQLKNLVRKYQTVVLPPQRTFTGLPQLKFPGRM